MRSDAGKDDAALRGGIGFPSSATPKLPNIVALKHLDGSAHPMLTSTKRLDVEMV